ncbi:hypothetical protein [Aliagarivorans marinus]|uniref:hypothetical protein n=1 Tax=Aliagarivorans marinus TaxID=561965 RepID=UPI0004224528|nr:hypothetical protein [Aliagarivorans marinus]
MEQIADLSKLKLQPLRIPAGWSVDYNASFWEIDPNPSLIPEDERWWVFNEDMLQMRHAAHDYMLDLGWYPEGDFETGAYRVVLLEHDFLGKEVVCFTTQNRMELVDKIESLLLQVSDAELVKNLT